MKPQTKAGVHSMTRAAIIAAIYCLLTVIFQPVSFGAVQFRVAEALTLLPIITPDAVPGLFVGCLIANLLGGGIWYDVVLGSIATLLAALAVRALRNRLHIAAAMPAIFNGLIIGPVVYFAYVRAPGAPVSWPVLLSSMVTVAIGEVVVCYVLGIIVVRALHHVPEKYLIRR